jgi:hypothetical protein
MIGAAPMPDEPLPPQPPVDPIVPVAPFESTVPPPLGGPPPGTPPGAPPERPKWKQVAIMVFGGLVLAFGGCFLFLATVDGNSGPSMLGGLIFVIGMLLLLIGGITGLVYVVTAIFRSPRT